MASANRCNGITEDGLGYGSRISALHTFSSKWCGMVRGKAERWETTDGHRILLQFTALDHVPKVAIENPIGIMSKLYRKPDQIIQPWQFGDNYAKSTCLWLKGLEPLVPKVTEKPELEYFEWVDKKTGKTKRQPKWFANAWKLPPNERAMVRSKTFPGIAKAMAEQWG